MTINELINLLDAKRVELVAAGLSGADLAAELLHWEWRFEQR